MTFVCVADASDLLYRAHRNSCVVAKVIQIRDDALIRRRYPLSCWGNFRWFFFTLEISIKGESYEGMRDEILEGRGSRSKNRPFLGGY